MCFNVELVGFAEGRRRACVLTRRLECSLTNEPGIELEALLSWTVRLSVPEKSKIVHDTCYRQ